MSDRKISDKHVDAVCKKLGIDRKDLPSEEDIKKEFKLLDDIRGYVENVPPRTLVGAFFFMSKGMDFHEAAANAYAARGIISEMRKDKMKKQEDTVDDDNITGASVRV